MGITAPAGSSLQSLILEIILTALLIFVILNVSVGAKERGITAGIAFGSVIALEALFAGPISGASMNPARSFAPALVSQHLAHLWIYVLAPVAGALLAVVGCRCVRKDCCSVPLHGMDRSPIMKQKVLFICVHNSVRSQMAEAFLNEICGDYLRRTAPVSSRGVSIRWQLK